MTFEEFFTKKRIDLELMRDAEPALYSEFKSHFESMGEKSFDHTKKFWFNKLRHRYHLADLTKKSVTQVETQIASQAEPLSSPTMEQNTPEIQSASQQEVKSPASPKTGFRPRNIPPAAAKAAEADKSPQAEPDAPADIPKPVSKPGFKPRNIKPVSGDLSDDAQKTASRPGQDLPSGASQGNAANAPRPAYKPRFSAGKTPQNTEKITEEKVDPVEGTPAPIENSTSGETPSSAAEQAKPAYKPRFNVKNIAAKAAAAKDPDQSKENLAGEVAETKPIEEPVVSPTQDNAAETRNEDTAPATGTSSKPAYKPRFNARTVAPKKIEESDSAPESESAEDTVSASNPTPVNTAAESAGDSKEQEKPTQADGTQDETAKTPVAKPAYKPRFNMKNIKPKD